MAQLRAWHRDKPVLQRLRAEALRQEEETLRGQVNP